MINYTCTFVYTYLDLELCMLACLPELATYLQLNIHILSYPSVRIHDNPLTIRQLYRHACRLAYNCQLGIAVERPTLA